MIRVAALGIEHRLVGDAPLFYVDPPRMGNLYDDGWREYLTAGSGRSKRTRARSSGSP